VNERDRTRARQREAHPLSRKI